MRALVCQFVLVLALLTSGTASAQEAKGWLGADVQNIAKAEADKALPSRDVKTEVELR
jgi:hypothetical protein